MLSKFLSNKGITLCNKLSVFEALEVVELGGSLLGGNFLAPFGVLPFLSNLSACLLDSLWGSILFNFSDEICKTEALDWDGLAGALASNNIDHDTLVINDINDNSEFVNKLTKNNEGKAANFDELCERHRKRSDKTV